MMQTNYPRRGPRVEQLFQMEAHIRTSIRECVGSGSERWSKVSAKLQTRRNKAVQHPRTEPRKNTHRHTSLARISSTASSCSSTHGSLRLTENPSCSG